MKDINKKFNIIKNKIIIISIIIIIIMNFSIVNADDEDEQDNDENEIENSLIEENTLNDEEKVETGTNLSNTKPQINSRRYAIFDRKSKTCIYGKDENKETAMASTTKIMTAIIVLENTENLNELVTVSQKAAGTGGSRLGLKKDDKLTINDLLYGLLMRSGNDAAVELAIDTAGSVEEFAGLMNQKAKELGLEKTNFVTPHGLDDPKHYTTAVELAKITDYALNNKKFCEIVDTQFATININGQAKELKNTNELLGKINGVYGVKTGFTNNAGRCLVTAIKNDKIDIIIVALGADTRKDRANDTIKLLKYVEKNYSVQNLEDYAQTEFEKWKEINEKRIYINKNANNINTKLENIPIKEILTKDELESEITNITHLEAPIEKETRIGTLLIKSGGKIVEEINIVTNQEVIKKGIIDYIKIFAKCIVE
jgi:D-alanyl-D-alanine carboxypeptidase (penicillin-binding protein 5/6)